MGKTWPPYGRQLFVLGDYFAFLTLLLSRRMLILSKAIIPVCEVSIGLDIQRNETKLDKSQWLLSQCPMAYQHELGVVATYLDDGGTSMSPHISHCPGSGGLGRDIQQTWSHFLYNLKMHRIM